MEKKERFRDLEFLLDEQNPVEDSKLIKKLKCSYDEALILKALLQSYFCEGLASIQASRLLCRVWAQSSYLSHLLSLNSLHEKGLVSINPAQEGLAIIHTELSPSSFLLLFLENKDQKIVFKNTPFKDLNSYLSLQFKRLELYTCLAKLTRQKKKLQALIDKYEQNIKKRLELSKEENIVEELFKEYKLDLNEQLIFLALLKQEYSFEQSGLNAQSLLEPCVGIKNGSYLKDNSKLLSQNIIEYEELFFNEFFRTYFLSEDIVQKILSPQKKLTNELQSVVKEAQIFELIEPDVDFSDIIMPQSTALILKSILRQKDKKVINRLKKWGVKSGENIEAKLIFYGAAGTGKTMSALALAKALKRPLLNLDCSKILSKYVGESEQNVRKVFDEYKRIAKLCKQDPILLLNEADQFLSTRSIGSSGAEKMHNQMQNIFLEQIEKFSGVLIATTNFLESLDTAFSRRFETKIEFKLPDEQARIALWEKYLPKNAPYKKDFSVKTLASFALSGAQIKLVVRNTALELACKEENQIFSEQSFITHIKKELSSSFDKQKTMGFM